jgi:hypothetical protein
VLAAKESFGDYTLQDVVRKKNVCTKTYFTSIGTAKLSSGKFALAL